MKLHTQSLSLGLALALSACQNENVAAPCGDGEAITINTQEICVYTIAQGIIENGFRCPPENPHRQDAMTPDGEPIIICADAPVDVEQVFEARGDAPQADREPEPPVENPGPDREPPEAPAPFAEPDNPEEPRLVGEQCTIALDECHEGLICWVCADGLECLPDAAAPAGRGLCAPERMAGPPGQMCEEGDHAACPAGQGCDEGVCAAFCAGDISCGMGESCAGRGSVCSPADPGNLFDACTPGAGDCAENESCQASAAGLFCAPSDGLEPLEACEFADECSDGALCAIHVGWDGDRVNEDMIFDLAHPRPTRHGFLGRSESSCLPACTADAPCAEGQTCNRIADPTSVGLTHPYFLHFGVCVVGE